MTKPAAARVHQAETNRLNHLGDGSRERGTSMRQITFKAGTVLLGTTIYVLIGMVLGSIG